MLYNISKTLSYNTDTQQLPISPSLSLQQAPFYFCFHVFTVGTSLSGTIQYLYFCDWFLSLSIMFSRLIHTGELTGFPYKAE